MISFVLCYYLNATFTTAISIKRGVVYMQASEFRGDSMSMGTTEVRRRSLTHNICLSVPYTLHSIAFCHFFFQFVTSSCLTRVFIFSIFLDLSDNPDVGGNSSAHGSVTPPPQALNFGSAGSGDMGLPYMTTESLLRKIQALLKAAADKIRDDDRALNFEKGESPDPSLCMLIKYVYTCRVYVVIFLHGHQT